MNRYTTAVLAIAASLLATAGDAGAATPNGQIFEPVNPVAAGQFQRLEFFMVALDADNDLSHCEMYVDAVRKGNAYFYNANNGATARWTYAFGDWGTHTVSFKPVDAAAHIGAEVAWTVNVTNGPGSLTLYAMTYNTHLFGESTAERLCSLIAGWPWTQLGWSCDLSKFLYDDVNRREHIAYKVQSSGMDIVALQEVWQPAWQQWFVDRLRYTYPHAVFYNSFCDSWLADANTLGNGLVLLSKWPLTMESFREFPTFFPSVQVSEADKSDHWANKGILTATVDAGGPVRVGISHALVGSQLSDYKSKWSTAYIANTITTFQLDGQPYLFAVDAFNKGHIVRFEDYSHFDEATQTTKHGAGWKQLYEGAWGSDHKFVIAFQMQGPLDSGPHPYLFGVNGKNEGHLERINNDPTTGWTTVFYGPWSSDHVAVTWFTMQGPLDSSPHPYLFGVNGKNEGHIERINDDPATGWTRMFSGPWGSDHVVVTSFQMQGPLDPNRQPYLFGVNGQNEGHIERIKEDPTMGWETMKYGSWDSNYRIVAPFEVAGVPYLFALHKDGADPNGTIFRIQPDPKNGWRSVHSAAWDSERIEGYLSYVAVRSFEMGGHPCLFALKKCCDNVPCDKLLGVPLYPSRCDPCERGLPGEAFLKRIQDIPTNGWQNLFQLEDIRLIRDETVVQGGPPTIIMGDFNIHENKYGIMDQLLRKSGAVDAYVAARGSAAGGETISSNNVLLTHFFGQQPSSRIDYVYVKQSGAGLRLTPMDAVVFTNWTYAVGGQLMDISDHYPVVVEFRLEPDSGEAFRLALSPGTNGLLQVNCTGELGRYYELQSSTNLCDWEKLVEFQLTTPSQLYVDPSMATTSARFYRLRLLEE